VLEDNQAGSLRALNPLLEVSADGGEGGGAIDDFPVAGAGVMLVRKLNDVCRKELTLGSR
jgi:hypothetical protein